MFSIERCTMRKTKVTLHTAYHSTPTRYIAVAGLGELALLGHIRAEPAAEQPIAGRALFERATTVALIVVTVTGHDELADVVPFAELEQWIHLACNYCTRETHTDKSLHSSPTFTTTTVSVAEFAVPVEALTRQIREPWIASKMFLHFLGPYLELSAKHLHSIEYVLLPRHFFA